MPWMPARSAQLQQVLPIASCAAVPPAALPPVKLHSRTLAAPADEDGADRSVEGGSAQGGSTHGSFATGSGKCRGACKHDGMRLAGAACQVCCSLGMTPLARPQPAPRPLVCAGKTRADVEEAGRPSSGSGEQSSSLPFVPVSGEAQAAGVPTLLLSQWQHCCCRCCCHCCRRCCCGSCLPACLASRLLPSPHPAPRHPTSCLAPGAHDFPRPALQRAAAQGKCPAAVLRGGCRCLHSCVAALRATAGPCWRARFSCRASWLWRLARCIT